MKKAILLFLIYACCSVAYPQNKEAGANQAVTRNMGLEASAGYSMALGAYASKDQKNKKSGYATNGWLVQVTFDWMGKKDFGMAIQYTFQQNPMENVANEVFPNGIPDSVGPGSWSNHYLMMGPVFMKTIGRIHLDAKIMGGAMVSSSANFSTPNPTDTTGHSYNKNIATGFAYQISAGIGVTLSSHFAVKFNLGLLGGWPGKNRTYNSQFIGYEEYYDPKTGIKYFRPIYSAPVEYDIKKVVATLNPSLGFVFRF